MSSALAIAVCTYSEHRWISSLGANKKLIKAWRYVDDASGVIAYSSILPNTKSRAEKIAKSYKNNCYPKDLILKPETIDNGDYKFLETLTTVKENTISVKHFLKNTESISLTRKQTFYNIKSSHSFESCQSKKGVLISRILSIEKNTPNDQDLKYIMIDFIEELAILKYPKITIKSCLTNMRNRSSRSVWSLPPKIFFRKYDQAIKDVNTL